MLKKLLIWIACFGNKNRIAKKLGVSFGTNCRFLGNVFGMFGSEPFLIEIGNHVSVSAGVVFLNHHGEIWVLRQNKKIESFGKIRVGNNVFIGQNSIICPGVTIGDNVVVGANSVVSRDVGSNSIVAGSPARVINSFDAFKEKWAERKTVVFDKTNRKSRDSIKDFVDNDSV